METFRSEYSEDGLSTSRFGGSASSAASLSFDSRSASRSDLVSSYELKFQARKAEKEKRRKKEREAAASNQASSAEDKWRAEREADRAVRRREMETWLPPPAALKRVARDSKKRTRERMQRVLSWYPPLAEEVHPQFAAQNPAAATGAALERVLSDQQRAADDDARRAMASGLQRRVDDLRLKVVFVECQAASSPARAKRGATRHRRPGREPLAPLRDGSEGDGAQLALARSASHSAMGVRDHRPPASATTNRASGSRRGLAAGTSGARSVGLLTALGEDDDEADDAETQQFLLLHHRQRKQHYYATKIQATWRMYRKRRVYLRWGRRRLKLRREVFEVWALAHRFKAKARLAATRKYFVAWRDEVGVAIRLREVELKLFRDAEMQAALPKLVVNLVFTSPSERDDPSARRQSPRVGGCFVNSAFASVEHFADSKKRRVQRTRVLHREARRAVVKKIVQRTFLLWKRVHAENTRVGLNAQLCIKRAVRLAFGSRPVWAGEKLLLIFGIWSRWAAFSRCKRAGRPLPVFAQALPQWDVWVFNHQERHVRQVKAAAKAPGARMLRYFRRLRTFGCQSARAKAQARAAATHFGETTTRKVLRAWRAAIAAAARDKKLCRSVFGRLRRYARVEAALRPLALGVARRKRLGDFGRAWRAWKGVHLRSFFKRELNVSRLEQREWRCKVHRIVHVWMSAKHEVNRWRTFEAWRDLCRRRRLFQTLRFHCARARRRHLLFGVLTAWKAFVWKQEDAFLEDRLKLSAWDAYEELSPYFPQLFYGCYSAAAAIFGGVATEQREDDEDDAGDARGRALARLRYDADGIRQFQSVVSQGSVAEVRNAVLHAKHLINAVDAASGNTPLHVAMQVEDPTHRCDVLSLLLSEGAATWHHANRHGLTPAQLAPSDDARRLLERGVYAFYAHEVLELRRRERRSPAADLSSSSPDDQRLVWCMVTLMSSEWVRGERLAGDVKVREWHSVLRDELWLRQERVIFASSSGFSPAILRCRAFLNGMKKKLARSCAQVLAQPPASETSGRERVAPLPVRKTLSLRGQQHVGMLVRIVDATDKQKHLRATTEEAERLVRARALGDLEAYARFLLTPTLDCDLAERDLVHSFVGVLFSLGVSAGEVLAHADRLDDDCAALEQRVLLLHDALARAQWEVPRACVLSPDPALLCCFASELDMELHFEKELLLLRVAALALERSGSVDGSSADGGSASAQEEPEALAKELASLVTKLQRKMRRVEKKKKAVEERVADAAVAYRATLSAAAAARSVRAICDARMALESARLRMAGVLLKYGALQAEISSAETAKARVAGGDALGDLAALACGADSSDAVARRRELLEVELVKCRPPFRTRELLVAAEGDADSAAEPTGAGCLDVRRRHKEAKAALRQLFVANLFRCCCCWLAENMLPPPPADDDNDDDALGELEETRVRLASVPTGTPALREGRPPAASRRRSSVSNSRKLVDTLHRGSLLVEEAERDAARMHESYAGSADLLFEAERAELQEAARRRQEELRNTAVEVVYERNPITGLPEAPPERLVDLRSLPQSVDARDSERRALPTRSRKKEELRRAVVEHQLQRVAAGDRCVERADAGDPVDGDAAAASSAQLPAVRGSVVAFGNFVACASPRDASALAVSPSVGASPSVGPEISARAIEYMWKRGAQALPSGKGAADGAGASESDADFSASFRVLSAARDRRVASERLGSAGAAPRPSDALPAGGDSRSGSARAAAADALAAATRVAATGCDLGAAEDDDGVGAVVALASEERQTSAEAADDAELAETPRGDEDAEGGADPERCDSVDADVDTNVGGDDEGGDVAAVDASLEASARLPEAGASDQRDDVAPPPSAVDSLDDHLLRMRADVERGSPPHSMPLASELRRRSERQSQPQSQLQPTHSGGCDDAGDAFAAGSRFLSFIRWEKKDAAPAAAVPRIFQDAPQPQEERDVRHAKRKATVAAAAAAAAPAPAPVERESESPRTRRSVCDPSTLALRGRAAVLAGARKRPVGGATSSSEQVPVSEETAPGDADAVLAAVPRVSITVVQAPASSADPSGAAAPAPPAEESAALGAEPDDAETFETERELLQLEGRAFASLARPSSDAAMAAAPKPAMKASAASRAPPESRARAAIARQHSDAALQLDGSKTGVRMAKSQSVGDVQTPSTEDAAAAAQLSVQQRQQVWAAFASLPLSDGVQDAYAVLYPHLYAASGQHEAAGDRELSPVSREPPALQLRALQDPRRSPSERSALQRDRRFWSAVEGFKAIGAPTSVLALDVAAVAARRHESARRIHAEFLHERSLERLAWLDMYPRELRAVAAGLRAAPPSLFDALQQTAQLRISTALSQRRRPHAPHE